MEKTLDKDEEIVDFYDNFQEKNNVLICEIINNEILEEYGKRFAVYTIEVKTAFMKYKIQKRYSQFHTLKEKLIPAYPEIDFTGIEFPGKKFFGNLNEEVLTARQVILNNYIRWLCIKNQDIPMIEFCEFLDIRAHYLLDMHKIQSTLIMGEEAKSKELEILFGYLEQLNKMPFESCRILKELSEFYMTAKPKLGYDMIKKLFLGCKKNRGIMSFCGQFNEETNTHLVCCIGLPFLVNLMSFDQNREADIFQEIFGNLKAKQLNCLNIENHLFGKTQRICKESAFKLLDLYNSRNPIFDFQELVISDESRKEYLHWRSMSNNSSRKVEQYHITPMDPMENNRSDLSKNSQDEDGLKNLQSFPSPNSVENFGSSPQKSLLSLSARLKKSSLTSCESKNRWTRVKSSSDIVEIEHQNHVYIRIKLTVKALPKDCITILTENLSWLQELKSVQFYSQSKTSMERYTKLEMKKCQNKKYISFFSKLKISEEDENQSILITERPGMPRQDEKEDELFGERTGKIEVQFIKNTTEGPHSRIKILYKNMDQNSINYTANEMTGCESNLEANMLRLKEMIENQKTL